MELPGSTFVPNFAKISHVLERRQQTVHLTRTVCVSSWLARKIRELSWNPYVAADCGPHSPTVVGPNSNKFAFRPRGCAVEAPETQIWNGYGNRDNPITAASRAETENVNPISCLFFVFPIHSVNECPRLCVLRADRPVSGLHDNFSSFGFQQTWTAFGILFQHSISKIFNAQLWIHFKIIIFIKKRINKQNIFNFLLCDRIEIIESELCRFVLNLLVPTK